MAYVDYMDLAVRCSRKAVKLNHSLTHSLENLSDRAVLLSLNLDGGCRGGVAVGQVGWFWLIMVGLIHLRQPMLLLKLKPPNLVQM